jgi:hypothetical protein
MGIAAEDITSGTEGFVQTFGILKPINTTGIATGEILWYDPAVTGGYTTVKPSAPNVKVQVAAVTAGNSAGGALLVRITAGTKLGETDSNVLFSTLTGGNLLIYDQTNAYWKNANLTDGTAISITETAGGTVTIDNTGVTALAASTGISVSGATGSVTITNTAPDQTVSLTAGTGISTSGTYPNFTITNTAPDQTVSISAGTGISVTGTYPSFTVTNTAPDVPFTYTTNYIPYGQGTTTPNQSANLTYDGTTLKAQAVNATNGIVVNKQTVSANYTIASGDSGMSAGPVTVASGVTVTVSSGSRWVVL